MLYPTTKYHGLPNDPVDGVPLNWRAHPDGYPVREGDTPALIEKARLAQAGIKLFVRSQCFNIPADLGEYVKVLDWIANTGGVLRSEDKQALGDGKWVTWVTWLDVRGTIPKDTGPGAMQ